MNHSPSNRATSAAPSAPGVEKPFLQASVDVHQALFERAAIGIALADLEGRFVRANQAYLNMVGYNEAELITRTVNDITHADDRELCRTLTEELLTGQRTSFHCEKRYCRKDGRIGWSRNTVSTVSNGAGRPLLLVGFAEDITQRREATAALEESHDRLRDFAGRLRKARETERTNIARQIHDELGQVLTALHLDLSWVEARLPDHDGLLGEKCRAMAELVQNTIGRVRNLASELRPAVLDSLGLPAAIEWETQQFTRRTGIPCTLDLPDEPLALDADRSTDVFRILQEALTNVARHSQAHHVDVRLRSRQGELQLRVSDDGRGFSADETESPHALGLMGMRERALPWNGTVDFHPRDGGGTVVTVCFPVADLSRKAP
jgi:two-component system sensor histidine kinase UhpB